jgi:hypothetical protein
VSLKLGNGALTTVNRSSPCGSNAPDSRQCQRLSQLDGLASAVGIDNFHADDAVIVVINVDLSRLLDGDRPPSITISTMSSLGSYAMPRNGNHSAAT